MPLHCSDRGSSTQSWGTLLLESSHPVQRHNKGEPSSISPYLGQTALRRRREANRQASGGRRSGRGSGSPSVSVPACTVGRSREVSADQDWASATQGGAHLSIGPPPAAATPEQIPTLYPKGLSTASYFREGPSATSLPGISRLP